MSSSHRVAFLLPCLLIGCQRSEPAPSSNAERTRSVQASARGGAPQLGMSFEPVAAPPQAPAPSPAPASSGGTGGEASQASVPAAIRPLAAGPAIRRKVLAVVYDPVVRYRLTGPGTITYDVNEPPQSFLAFALANLTGDADATGTYIVPPEFYSVEDTSGGPGLRSQFLDWVSNTTGGRVTYDVVQTQTILHFPQKVPDGGGPSYTLTRQEYADCINAEATGTATSQRCRDMADYQSIASDIDLCARVNAGEFDEVWMFGGPYMGFYESRLVGPRGFAVNSPPLVDASCNKMVTVMGFAYNREVSEMIHDLGHRTEFTMSQVYRESICDHDENNNWDRFHRSSRVDNSCPSTYLPPYGCGSIHFAPGAASGVYDTGATVASTCDEFASYPTLQGTTVNIDPTAWSSTAVGYYTWWFQHLPSFSGVNNDWANASLYAPPDYLLNDWWQYVIDPNHVERPPDQPGLLVAQYYAGTNLDAGGTLLPEWVQYEAAVDYDWGRSRPATVPARVTAIDSGNFSVRWSGKLPLDEAGTYVFSVMADEGVRLRVDLNGDGTIDPATETVVDDWADTSRQTELRVERPITGTPGDRAMVLEYWDRRATGPVRFSYYHRCQAAAGQFCASYYANKDMAGIPVLELIERPASLTSGMGISHPWGTGGPAGLSNRFSARWEGDVDFGPTLHRVTFSTNSSDGMRLYVDNALVVDDWSNHRVRMATQSLEVSGTKRIRVEYYENSGDAQAEFFWNTPPEITNEAQLSRYAIAGGSYAQRFAATDLEGNAVSFSLLSGPTGLVVGPDGRVTWTPVGAAGSYQYVAEASDAQLTDTATMPLTVLAVNAKHDFGPVALGTSKQVTFRIWNSGGGYLLISDVRFTDGDVRELSVVQQDCIGNPLPPSSGEYACRVTMEIRPDLTGTQSAVLSVVSNAGNSPLRIGVYGEGT